MNNLRRIGVAYNVWAADHNERFPWWVPAVEGGLANPSAGTPWAGLQNNLWFQYAWISDGLVTRNWTVLPSGDGLEWGAPSFSVDGD